MAEMLDKHLVYEKPMITDEYQFSEIEMSGCHVDKGGEPETTTELTTW